MIKKIVTYFVEMLVGIHIVALFIQTMALYAEQAWLEPWEYQVGWFIGAGAVFFIFLYFYLLIIKYTRAYRRSLNARL